MNRHREIAGMMQVPDAGPPPGDDDWTNLWYFTETDGAGGAQVNDLDHRGTAPVTMSATSTIVTIDGAYAARNTLSVGIAVQVSDLAADGLDVIDTSQPYTWISGVYSSRSFSQLVRQDVTGSAPSVTNPDVAAGGFIRFLETGGTNKSVNAYPGTDLRMIIAVTRDGAGNEYGYVVSGYSSDTLTASVATPPTVPTVLGWDRLPTAGTRGGVYWSGIQHKFMQLSDIQALWAAWDAATVGGDALWKPGL